jgi:outer membrane protein OmpA-like peptidoglycan-associated protein
MLGTHLLALGMLLSAGAAAADTPQPSADLYFEFDSSAIAPPAANKLAAFMTMAEDMRGFTFVLDAHADSRGTDPYNVALSIRRAEAVRDELIALGVDPDDIVLAANGEDAPRRASFAQDRRVSISLSADPLWAIIDQSKFATAVVWNDPVTLAEIEGPADKTPQTARR